MRLAAAAALLLTSRAPSLAVSARNTSCATCTQCCLSVLNGTGWTGNQLINTSWDSPIEVNAQLCCSLGTSAAPQRSRNSTAPLPWASQDIGPAKDPERAAAGQRSYLCVVYDDGATQTAAHGSTAATTPPVPFFPPPPPPCSSYSELSSCPKRCFWTSAVCASKPPLECGSNVPGTPHRNNALCVHLILNNTSNDLQLHFTGMAGSFNETIIQHPPALLSADKDAW